MNNKIIIGILVALVVLLGGTVLFSNPSVGGLVHNTQEIFSAGIKAGSSALEVIDSSGNWVGALNLSSSDSATLAGTNVFSGTNTLSGTNTVSGASTFSGTVSVSQTVSSTVAVGGLNKTGCIALGDSASTSSIVYITATSETITATTTKPAICR